MSEIPWFKVDDAFATHPKAIKAGNAAVGLWTRAGSWCAQQLTDGFVPSYVVPMLGGADADAERLIEVRLWEAVDDGFQFRDWLDFQPSKTAVEAERVAARERQRRAREAASARRHGVSHGVTSPELLAQSRSPHPIPSHPDHKDPAPADADNGFDTFWALYPKKVGKGQAVRAYRAAVKKTTADNLVESLTRQLPWFEAQSKPEGDFRPQASTWLNGERWGDVLDTPAPKSPQSGPRDQWARAVVVGGK